MRSPEDRLADPDLSGRREPGWQLADVEVERGNLAGFAAPELTVRRVVFRGARMTGVEWTRGTITDVEFHDCRIDLATFAATTFERVRFVGCLMMEVELREALLRKVRFEHCDLSRADLTGLRLKDCELRSCTLEGVAGLERLRGAAMPWHDIVGSAGALADALGIRVLEE